MSKNMERLSLGALPRAQSVKLTITISAELKMQLDAYAEVHARLHQVPVDATVLVPHMLAAFIARDRGFRMLRGKPVMSKRVDEAQRVARAEIERLGDKV